MNLQELLDHYSEIKSTLSNGLVGQRLANEGQSLSNNIQQSFPFLKPNPTIDDLVNSFGTVGAIKYLYHATPINNLTSIAKIGLKPSKQGYEGPGVYFSKLKTGGEGYDFSKPDYAHLRVNAKSMKDIFGDRFEGSLNDAIPNDYGIANDVRIDSPIPIPSKYFEVEQDGIWKALEDLLKKKGP